MSAFPLRLTDELKAIVAAQAARAGVSVNQYIATVLAIHAGAQAETER
jgi:predicted HicB family RNase H-like nuclease